MNPYNFSLLLFAFSEFFLGVLVWLKRLDKLALRYFIFSTSASIWAAIWSILISDNISNSTALLCSRLSHVAGGLTGITWFHFCLVLVEKNKRYKKFIVGFYALSILFSMFSFSKLFVSEIQPGAGFVHYTKTGPILDAYIVLFLISVVWAFVDLGKVILKYKGEKRIQIIGFFVSTFIGFSGGIGTLLPLYGVNFPQYNLFIIPIYPFVMAYFIIKKGFFDPEVIAQLFQREKLATIGLLAASVNHEIRNPLYAARSILESYSESLDKGKVNNSKEAIIKIKMQIDRALEVITKLNRFAKPTADETFIDHQASIPEAIQNVLDLVSYEFKPENIKINNQISNNLSPIKADQRQLEEILFNLIVNACYAMEQGGELVIASEAKQSTIQIIIQDSGSGISQDQMKHLFEPFHTTKGDKGTGLGLYITKQLVERNGGKIFVSSKPNQGTSFTLEFKIK